MDYIEIAAIAGEAPGLRLISNMNVHADRLYDGRLLPVSRSSAGRPKYQLGNDFLESIGWLRHYVGREEIESFILEIDGQRLENHWMFVNAMEVEPGHGVIILKHELRPVGVEVHTRVDGTAYLERWLVIENADRRPAALSYVAPASGIVWQSENETRVRGAFELYYFNDQRFGYEGDLTRFTLPSGKFSYASTTGRSGWGAPFFMVCNRLTGEIFAASLEWSSNWSFDLTSLYPNGGAQAALLFSMGPKATAPIKILPPGEKLVTPTVHFGIARGGLDECARQMHEHIRRSVMGKNDGRPFLPVGGGRVVEGGMDFIRHEADMAAMMGMEYFLVDAGWYGNEFGDWFNTTGDWNVGGWLKGTLSETREYIHSKGMKFGLWMEPESAGSKSKTAKEHHDWFMNRDGRPISGGRLLDLAKPQVAKWVEEQIIGTIETHKPDFLKIDYNCGEINDTGENDVSGYYENSSWGHVQAFFDIMERVRARFPELYLENCAGGGGRNDLGMVRRFDILCHSDYTITPRSLYAVNNLTFFFPPETLRYYFAHWPGYHLTADYDFQIRAAMLANPLFVGFGLAGCQVNEAEKEKIVRHVKLYKDFIRPIMKNCRAHHHTGVMEFNGEQEWCVVEYGAENGSKSVIYAFRLKNMTGQGLRIWPKGIDLSYSYQITRVNSGVKQLLNDSIYIELEGEFTSELLFIERME